MKSGKISYHRKHTISGLNGSWHLGGVSTPLLQDFFVKNIGILYAYDFLTLFTKILLANF